MLDYLAILQSNKVVVSPLGLRGKFAMKRARRVVIRF